MPIKFSSFSQFWNETTIQLVLSRRIILLLLLLLLYSHHIVGYVPHEEGPFLILKAHRAVA
jgi:hypothetical protein